MRPKQQGLGFFRVFRLAALGDSGKQTGLPGLFVGFLLAFLIRTNGWQ